MNVKNDVLTHIVGAEDVNSIQPTERDSIFAFIRDTLAEIGGFTLDELSESASLDGELVLESISLIELQVAIEERYDLQLDPVTLVEMNFLGRIADYVHILTKHR